MTVIAAVAHGGRIVMAADTQTNYQNQAVFGTRKIRRLRIGDTSQDVLFGVAGNGAVPNLIAQHLKIDDAPSLDCSDDQAHGWAEAVASAATEILAGSVPPMLATDGNDQSQAIDGALLLGHGGRLFYLFTHQAALVPDGIASLGSGGEVALGVMHASLAQNVSPTEAVIAAVKLACRFSPFCGVGHEPSLEHLG